MFLLYMEQVTHFANLWHIKKHIAFIGMYHIFCKQCAIAARANGAAALGSDF